MIYPLMLRYPLYHFAKSIQIMCQRHKYVENKALLMQRLVGGVQYLDTGVYLLDKTNHEYA